jgi:hypothetical protein
VAFGSFSEFGFTVEQHPFVPSFFLSTTPNKEDGRTKEY